jgi:HK97 family phage prohead protease
MSNLLERRILAMPVEVRQRTGQAMPLVGGYAALFNRETVIGDTFRERINPGAFRNAIGTSADIRALYNHDDNIVLARTTNGTLRLREDRRGLYYEFDPNPEDPDAQRVVAKIRRGDVSQSSFGFRVKSDTWTQPATRSDLPLRTITEFEVLRDVSPVVFAAYDETTVSAEARRAAARCAGSPTSAAGGSAWDHSAAKARLDLLRLENEI